MLVPQEIIRLKRDGASLNKTHIKHFVTGLVDGCFTDAQVAAMAMAIFQQGMTTDETVDLTNAMMLSGETLTWSKLDAPIVDKHSTGGVGDKVSFMLGAIVAACGVYVPMISGRGLGHTGGTADKLESIDGMNIQPSINEFQSLVIKNKLAIITQTNNLAPADKRLYGIRDITATVESIPLITASILSKKLAAGLDALVMDVKVGNGAMMQSLEQAQMLANSIVNVAKGAGVNCQAFITDMNQVLGNSAGNAVEMFETVNYLTGTYKEPRLHQVVVTLASAMLLKAGVVNNEQAAQIKINDALDSGNAAQVFAQMIFAMGGPHNFIEKPWQSMPQAKFIVDIKSSKTGFIETMQTRNIGMLVVELGGGRLAAEQLVDHSVGFDEVLAVGCRVQRGDIIARVHANTKHSAQQVSKQYLDNIAISENKPVEQAVIYQSMG